MIFCPRADPASSGGRNLYRLDLKGDAGFIQRMRMTMAAMIWMMVAGAISAEEPSAFPYEEFARFSEKMPGQKIDGVVLIPAYLKPITPGNVLDAAKANFRIRMADGTTAPLRCDVLPANADDAKDPADIKKIQGGFTHKLWIPKDPEKYKGAALLNDLPAGYLDIHFPLPPREVAPAQ